MIQMKLCFRTSWHNLIEGFAFWVVVCALGHIQWISVVLRIDLFPLFFSIFFLIKAAVHVARYRAFLTVIQCRDVFHDYVHETFRQRLLKWSLQIHPWHLPYLVVLHSAVFVQSQRVRNWYLKPLVTPPWPYFVQSSRNQNCQSHNTPPPSSHLRRQSQSVHIV